MDARYFALTLPFPFAKKFPMVLLLFLSTFSAGSLSVLASFRQKLASCILSRVEDVDPDLERAFEDRDVHNVLSNVGSVVVADGCEICSTGSGDRFESG